jgi:hypothetical protein
MSSIKQVQDLQTQLADAKREITQLQTILRSSPSSHVPNSLESPQGQQAPKLPPLGFRSSTGHGPAPTHSFEDVRNNIRTYSRGVFKVPPKNRAVVPTLTMTMQEVNIPPRRIVDVLLRQFFNFYSVHRPIVDKESFMREVDRLYNTGSQGRSQTWLAAFFGALACGTLQTPKANKTDEGMNSDMDGIQYMVISSRLLNTWTDVLGLDHACTSMMISLFFVEQNIQSAGWIWLGSSVRVIQELGLYLERGPWSPLELELRRKIYWAIYSYDRLLTLDGRPLHVYEEEHEVPWPSSTREQWMAKNQGQHPTDQEGDDNPNDQSANQTQTVTSTMKYVIPVVRFIPQLKKTLRSPVIAPGTLETYDEYFRSILSTYDEVLQPDSDLPFEPFLLHAALPLQAARLTLYRHNLNPHCTAHERREAVSRCLTAAYDTVLYVERCLDQSTQHHDYQNKFPSQEPSAALQSNIQSHASNFICKHLWRCALILSFKGDFRSTLTCVKLSSIIGDMRKVNIGCGRNLSNFLDKLKDRMDKGLATPYQLDMDEEMIAYASGDVQGVAENAWVWDGDEVAVGVGQQAMATPSIPAATESEKEPGSASSSVAKPTVLGGNTKTPVTALLTEPELHDWGGWHRVESLLNGLIEDQERQMREQREYHQSSHNSGKRVQLDSPKSVGSGSSVTGSASPTAGAARISIANII